jgi:hypothetical protein
MSSFFESLGWSTKESMACEIHVVGMDGAMFTVELNMADKVTTLKQMICVMKGISVPPPPPPSLSPYLDEVVAPRSIGPITAVIHRL